MGLKTQVTSGEQAWEISKWCNETAEALRDHCQTNDSAARLWWENDCDKPTSLTISPRPSEDMMSFAERLQSESYEWAGEAGKLFAEERSIEATVRVERFSPADEFDSPHEGEDLTTPSKAVALRFDFDGELIDLLKDVLQRVRFRRSGRRQTLGKIPWAGGWSRTSRCWWVLSTYWEEVRQALLDSGVELTGPLANPGRVKGGFFERKQTWDVKQCGWR